MDCQETQECILESLVEPLEIAERRAMENHLAACDMCTRFFEIQRALDARLATALPPAHLSPSFRTSLRRRIHHVAASSWPDFLPDLAHLAGCAVAVVLLPLFLPWHAGTVVLVGAAFAAVTYFLQAVLRSSFDELP